MPTAKVISPLRIKAKRFDSVGENGITLCVMDRTTVIKTLLRRFCFVGVGVLDDPYSDYLPGSFSGAG